MAAGLGITPFPIGPLADETGLRLLAGSGNTRTGFQVPGRNTEKSHLALQAMIHIGDGPPGRAWGIEVADHEFFSSTGQAFTYRSAAIMVQQRFVGVLFGQGGMAGYFPREAPPAGEANSPGLRASLFVEPELGDGAFFTLGLRQDVVFAVEKLAASSLDVGLAVRY